MLVGGWRGGGWVEMGWIIWSGFDLGDMSVGECGWCIGWVYDAHEGVGTWASGFATDVVTSLIPHSLPNRLVLPYLCSIYLLTNNTHTRHNLRHEESDVLRSALVILLTETNAQCCFQSSIHAWRDSDSVDLLTEEVLPERSCSSFG